MQRQKLIILLILGVFIMTSGFGCKQNIVNKEQFKPITLEYWGVWETPEQMQGIINAYQQSHPTIKVNYKNFRYEEYEQKLLEAAWEDRVPDVFMIPATWLKKYQDRLSSMPKSVKIPVTEIKGSIKKEAVTTLETVNSLTQKDVETQYVDVVFDDVVIDEKIYGLPYSVDTLVTFYNKNLLTQSGIAEPMVDFHDLVDHIQKYKLSKIGQANTVLQSGVAMGGYDNIPRFFDIISNLMLQNEVKVQDASFDPLQDQVSATKLAEVLSFYTDFASPSKAVYSWNSDLSDAFELFTQGKLAYFFGYSYHADELRKRGVQFDWDMTNFPQTRGASDTMYYSNYWINVVPLKSKNIDAAWNFIQSTASKNMVSTYLETNKKPTALRSLINTQLQNDDVRIFASQVLTANNWYNGYDIDLAETYLADFIRAVQVGELKIDDEGLNFLVKRLNQTYKKPE